MNRYSQRELIAKINVELEPYSLVLCTLADSAGVPELGCHFILSRRKKIQIDRTHVDLMEMAHGFGLVEFPAELHA